MSPSETSSIFKPVIVGSGPAGIRAAQTLVRHGIRPTVIDESATWGGQIYRQQPAHFKRSKKELYGFETSRANSVHRAMADILPKIDYQPDTLVWNAQDQLLDSLHRGSTSVTSYTHLIVATGATDRILPFAGWTLPGVYSLGAAQIALKAQGCAIGERVVFMGTGPLLYLVAYQYAKAGANVVAVLDTATNLDRLAAIPKMMAQPMLVLKGIYYTAWLRKHGVRLHLGIKSAKAHGPDRVTSIEWQDVHGQLHNLKCDAIGFGYALRSETQLADLLGCRFAYDPVQRAHLPVRDDCGRSSVQNVYLAGDGAGIMGADAAEIAGELAALTLIADAHPEYVQNSDQNRIHELQGKLKRIQTFRHGLERAFPFPENWAKQANNDLIICRCEEITAGDIRKAVQGGATEMNRVKALTRVGMGRCQSRMCAVAAAEIIADCSGIDISEVGRLRGQPPIKPIPFVTEPESSFGLPKEAQ